MDNTGGDLVHAAKELDVNIEKESQHSLDDAQISLAKAMDEKHHQQSSGSSGSSSISDAPKLGKLDSVIVKVEDSKDDDAAYAHLPPNERDTVKKQLHIADVPVTYWTLFRYATNFDLAIIFISAICAIAGGAALPLMTVGDKDLYFPCF